MDRSVRVSAGRLFFAVVLLGLGLSAQAQDEAPVLAKDTVALLEQRIAEADSAGDAVAGATLRMELAGLVKPFQGLKLVQEAAIGLDSAATSPELAMRVHRELAERYTSSSALEKAGREWAEVARLSDVLRSEAASAVEQAHFMNAVAQGRIDSLTTALSVAKADHRNAIENLMAEQARREEYALYAMIGGLVLLLLSVLFFSLHIRRQRAELKEVRQELTWLRMVAKKGTEPTVVATSVAPPAPPKVELPQVVQPPPVSPAPAVAAERTEEDAMLLALVRRRGVERLQTLREARATGDNDKVVRVVHTMKPQLVSLDAPYFTELCGRLVSTDPRMDPARWAEDLDRFEAGMTRVIEQRG